MPRFFPERTIIWAEQEIAGLRRWTLVPARIGLATGVALRILNSLVMTYGPVNRWAIVAWWYVLAAILLCGAVTAHLANYTVRSWLWRAPVFALWETAGGALASALLIAVGRDFWGVAHAHFDDWPTIVLSTLVFHGIVICLFSGMLALVVELLREILLRHEPAPVRADWETRDG
jgi:hypothetical protein